MARYYQPTTGFNTEAKYMPLNLDFMNDQINKLGEKHRGVVKDYNDRVAAVGDMFSHNLEEKNRVLGALKDNLKGISNKYNGDLARGASDITGAIALEKSNPFYQANKAHVKAMEEQEKLKQELKSKGKLLNFKELTADDLYANREAGLGQAGRYNTTFDYDMQEQLDYDKRKESLVNQITKDSDEYIRRSKDIQGYLEKIGEKYNEEKIDKYIREGYAMDRYKETEEYTQEKKKLMNLDVNPKTGKPYTSEEADEHIKNTIQGAGNEIKGHDKTIDIQADQVYLTNLQHQQALSRQRQQQAAAREQADLDYYRQAGDVVVKTGGKVSVSKTTVDDWKKSKDKINTDLSGVKQAKSDIVDQMIKKYPSFMTLSGGDKNLAYKNIFKALRGDLDMSHLEGNQKIEFEQLKLAYERADASEGVIMKQKQNVDDKFNGITNSAVQKGIYNDLMGDFKDVYDRLGDKSKFKSPAQFAAWAVKNPDELKKLERSGQIKGYKDMYNQLFTLADKIESRTQKYMESDDIAIGGQNANYFVGDDVKTGIGKLNNQLNLAMQDADKMTSWDNVKNMKTTNGEDVSQLLSKKFGFSGIAPFKVETTLGEVNGKTVVKLVAMQGQGDDARYAEIGDVDINTEPSWKELNFRNAVAEQTKAELYKDPNKLVHDPEIANMTRLYGTEAMDNEEGSAPLNEMLSSKRPSRQFLKVQGQMREFIYTPNKTSGTYKLEIRNKSGKLIPIVENADLNDKNIAYTNLGAGLLFGDAAGSGDIDMSYINSDAESVKSKLVNHNLSQINGTRRSK